MVPSTMPATNTGEAPALWRFSVLWRLRRLWVKTPAESLPSKTDDSTFSLVLYLMDGEKCQDCLCSLSRTPTQGPGQDHAGSFAYAGETIAAFWLLREHQWQGNCQLSDEPGRSEHHRWIPACSQSSHRPPRWTESSTPAKYIFPDLADYEEVRKYNVYAVYADGTETYVGGAYDDNYYVKDTIYDANRTVSFKVTAVGEDGRQTPLPAVATGTGITGLTRRDRSSGCLGVSLGTHLLWSAPLFAQTWFCLIATLATPIPTAAFLTQSATSGQVSIPVVDGGRYTLRLTYLDAGAAPGIRGSHRFPAGSVLRRLRRRPGAPE